MSLVFDADNPVSSEVDLSMADSAGKTRHGRLYRLITGIWTGVVLLVVLTAYLVVASIVAEVTRPAEGAEGVNLYRHPLLILLTAAVCVNMLAATFTRVPATAAHMGAYIAHGGVIILAAGAMVFAFARVHGDLLTVRTPQGWSPVTAFYVADTRAIYLADSIDGMYHQTGFDPDGFTAAEPLAVTGPDEDTRVEAVDYSRRTALLPIAQLRITEDGEHRDVDLPAGAGPASRVETDRYVLMYQPDVSARELEEFTAEPLGLHGPDEDRDLALLVHGPELSPTLVVARADDTRAMHVLDISRPARVELGGEPVEMMLHSTVIRPPEREVPDAPVGEAVALRIVRGDWETVTWVPFTTFTDLAPPERIDTPGEPVMLEFSRQRKSLPGVLHVRESEYITQPGSVVPRDYRCEVELETAEGVRRVKLGLNKPVRFGPLQVSQGSWLPEPQQPMQIQLHVTTRPGLAAVWIGCGLTVAGLLYGFYVKPLILRRKGRRT